MELLLGKYITNHKNLQMIFKNIPDIYLKCVGKHRLFLKNTQHSLKCKLIL